MDFNFRYRESSIPYSRINNALLLSSHIYANAHGCISGTLSVSSQLSDDDLNINNIGHDRSLCCWDNNPPQFQHYCIDSAEWRRQGVPYEDHSPSHHNHFDANGVMISSTNNDLGTSYSNKRRKMNFQEPPYHQVQTTENVPAVKRSSSKKLADKITKLQKLVSPYGKTDTASVLLEACISINALQLQIQKLFHMLPDNRALNVDGERALDLETKGLCLAPLSQAKRLKLAADSPS